jgi:Ni,Fe-hydrogenase III large subunit
MTLQSSGAATVNVAIGPIHVELEEPIYFDVAVEGEIIRSLDIHPGHVHRGVEYLTTKRSIHQNVVLTERICSLCSNSHPAAFAMAVEAIAGIAVPPRAEGLRVIADEIKRIASNLFNVAVLAHLIGDEPLFMHVLETREIVQDLKESLFGNRMDLGAICIGGVRRDLDDAGRRRLVDQLTLLAPKIDAIRCIYQEKPQLIARTRGVGVLTHDQALACGVVGPVGRASNVAYDVRTAAPYAAYDRLDVPVVTMTDGDVWSRAIVRLREARIAVDLILTVVETMPAGAVRGSKAMPEIPAGQAVAKVEAPRGELVYFVKTNGSDYPERVKWRVPSQLNWEALRFMLQGARLSDATLIINSIDPCVSCTDR